MLWAVKNERPENLKNKPICMVEFKGSYALEHPITIYVNLYAHSPFLKTGVGSFAPSRPSIFMD